MKIEDYFMELLNSIREEEELKYKNEEGLLTEEEKEKLNFIAQENIHQTSHFLKKLKLIDKVRAVAQKQPLQYHEVKRLMDELVIDKKNL